MKKRIIFSAIACSLFFTQGVAAAITYDLTPTWEWSLDRGEARWKGAWVAANSPCSFDGYYSRDLSVYVCPSQVYLSSGDSIVTGGSTSQLVLARYAYFWGGNNIGTQSRPLSLDLNGNSFFASKLTINGDIDNASHIKLIEAKVTGNVTSQNNSNTSIFVSDNSSITGNVIAKGHVDIADSQVSGSVYSLNDSGNIKDSQISGNVSTKEHVEIQNSQVQGAVSSSHDSGKIKNSKIKGSVQVKNNLDVVSNSYICGVASSENEQGDISDSYIGDDVSTKKYLYVTRSTVFGTVSTFNRGMKLYEAKILADSKALEFPSNRYLEISSNTALCGTANSSYSYGGRVVAYCGLNDPSCSAQQSKGKCPVDLVSSSEYRDFYDFCGITPPEPEPLPDPQICINEDFSGENPLQNWTVMGRTANTTKPQVVGNRFQVSTNKNDQSTASAYKVTIPSDDNVVQIEFDHYARSSTTNPGGDGIAIVLSDANIPPSPGATGGALGYGVKPDMEGFAGGWIAFGIDEYGNFSSQGSVEPSDTSPGRKKHSIAIRGAGYQASFNGSPSNAWFGGYKFIANNTNVGSLDEKGGYDSHDNYLAGRNSSDVHRYRMMVDSREDIPGRASGVWVSIERRINNSEWESIIEPFDVMKNFGQPEPPKNFIVSITAGTGLNTNIHEVANLKLCADQFNLEPKIDHFRFEYDGSGDVCDAQRVTLTACMDSECTETYPPSELTNPEELEVTLTGLSNAEWQFSNGQSISNNTLTFKHQVNLQIRSQGAESVKLGIDRTSIETPNIEPIKCKLNGKNDFDPACTMHFDSSITVDVPDKVAALPFFAKDGSQQYSSTPFVSLCESVPSMPETDIVKDIEMMFAYEQPKSGETVTVRFKGSNGKLGAPVQLNTTGWTTINDVYFTSHGKANFDLSYPEVGKISVKARIKDDSDSGNFSSFVSFPARLELTASSGNKNGTCENIYSGCSTGFTAAGEVFDLTITAYQGDGSIAKNYQEKNIVISNSVKYPSTGSSAKLLNEKLPESSQWSRGSVTFDQSVSDVGAFEFKAQAPIATDENGDELDKSLYLGSNAFKIQDGNLTVGRFHPDYFKVTGTEWTYPDNQNQSVYMGQNFESVKFEVTAYNANGYTTQNYGGFANSLKADLYLAGGYSDRLSILDSDLESDNWSGAVWSKTWDNSVYWRKDLSLSSPDGPFNSKLPADKDSSTETSIALSLNNDGSKVSGYVDPTRFLKEGLNSTKERMVSQQLLSQPDVRFGRIALDDVGVNQGKSVNIPLRVEYWRDNRFVLNRKDNGTTVSPTLKSQEPVWPDDGSDCDILLEGIRTTVNDGAMRELIAKQERTDCGRQQAEVWLNLDPSGNNLPWLKYDWDNDGEEENPSSVVTFGIHRGNDRVIYRGEPGLTAQ
ncbi:DUF6701 domain-containing protein [Vibrio natriegens]|uniref:DUF6701 domain-containing protein n=1 Tax=Vibrio natriegens TaxID=691 RepID=UPI003B5C812B